MKTHIAEMILQARLHGKKDALRKAHPFSEDIEAAHAVLFRSAYSRKRKIRAYWNWLTKNQPCLFGRMAATQKTVFVCLLEEAEILAMRKGDADLKDTIQDHRQIWKRYALEGLSSSFVVLLVSPTLASMECGDSLKEICRRLMELYMEIPTIPDDSIIPQREYVFLRDPRTEGAAKLLKFSTLPNIFCAQGDGRWWADHRTPGGTMITSNALGHFLYSRSKDRNVTETGKAMAVEQAMRTIMNAFKEPGNKARKSFKHCPMTFLLPRDAAESPVPKLSADLAAYSPNQYGGYFHTDHLIPSIFFRPDRDAKDAKRFTDLSLRYIHDAQGDPQDHRELVLGQDASWFEVRRNMDRIPEFADPETVTELTPKVQGQLSRWLGERLAQRCQC